MHPVIEFIFGIVETPGVAGLFLDTALKSIVVLLVAGGIAWV